MIALLTQLCLGFAIYAQQCRDCVMIVAVLKRKHDD